MKSAIVSAFCAILINAVSIKETNQAYTDAMVDQPKPTKPLANPLAKVPAKPVVAPKKVPEKLAKPLANPLAKVPAKPVVAPKKVPKKLAKPLANPIAKVPAKPVVPPKIAVSAPATAKPVVPPKTAVK